MRGFASILFLMMMVGLLVTLALPLEGIQTDRRVNDVLLLRRTEMEKGIDQIVREGLQEGLITQLPSETIRTHINQKIIDYLNAFPAQHDEPIAYEMGFGHLTHQSYLTLLLLPVEKPLTLIQLNQNSHVLVLPVSQTIRYGEYAYTGGEFGTSILSVRMHANEHRTLFVLPSGYRICGMTGKKELPCVAEGE
ncbi:MAG: hypothetical protein AABX02_03445 [archaeon]